MEKKKNKDLSQNIMELNHQLQIERDLRAKARVDEAVDIADELLQKLEMCNNSHQPSVTLQMLNAELQTKMDSFHQEVLQMNQFLEKEKELRAQAEAEKIEALKVAEAH